MLSNTSHLYLRFNLNIDCFSNLINDIDTECIFFIVCGDKYGDKDNITCPDDQMCVNHRCQGMLIDKYKTTKFTICFTIYIKCNTN